MNPMPGPGDGENTVVSTEAVEFDPRPLVVQPFDPNRFHAETARKLAFVLIALLAGTFITQQICVTILFTVGQKEAAASLLASFDKWLPGVTALVGSAVGYFFSKTR
jgi:hypothetical protein